MATLINLTPDQSGKIKQFVSNGDFVGGYLYVKNIIDDANTANDSNMAMASTWFADAAQINGDSGFLGPFSRGYVEQVASDLNVTITDDKFQNASNFFAQNLLSRIAADDQIPDIQTIVPYDISNMESNLGLPQYAWPGTLGDVFFFGNSYASVVDASGKTINTVSNFCDALDGLRAGIDRALVDLAGDLENFTSSIISDLFGPGGMFSNMIGVPFPDGTAPVDSDFISSIFHLFGDSMTDPLVIDLSGNGVQLVPVEQSNAYFDLHNTRFAVHTGWVGPQTGLLVQDRNENGKIDNVTELFGNSSTDGFGALSALDTNHDGVIDSRDPGFSTLQVWTDGNGNGVTDPGELQTLSDLQIESISLTKATVHQSVGGDSVDEVTTYTKADGTSGEVAEAYFDNSPVESRYTGSYQINPIVLTLPNLRGYGTVPDLYVSMSQDPALLQMVQSFAGEGVADAQSFIPQVRAILYRWAGVEDIAPTSRGSFVDAQELGVLENFCGEGFIATVTGGKNPWNEHQHAVLHEAFNQLMFAEGARLLAQGPLAAVLPGVSFSYRTDSLMGSANPASIIRVFSDKTPVDAARAEQYWANVAPVLGSLCTALGATQSAYLNTLQAEFNSLGLPFAADIATAASVLMGDGDTNQLIAAVFKPHYIDGGASVRYEQSSGHNDTFVFNKGYGALEINEVDYKYDDVNVLKFGAGITLSDLTVKPTLGGMGLVVSDGQAGDELIIDHALAWGYQPAGVGSVQFADGTTLTVNQLIDALETTGTNADDDLYGGTAGGNLFDGKGGFDVETGNGNGDTFAFDRGYGQLTIDETNAAYNLDVEAGIATNGTNVLSLGVGITLASLSVRATTDGSGLILTDGVTGDQITIANMLAVPGQGIQQVAFADGTNLSAAQLIQMETTGTASADVLYGTANGGNVFDGKGGGDIEIGNGGDTFTFNAGYGALTIEQTQRAGNTNASVLAFGPAITENALSVSIASNGSDLVLTYGVAGDKVVLSNALSSSPTIQEVSFSDGTTMSLTELLRQKTTGGSGNDTLIGTSGAESFDGKGGNDLEIGNGGADTFVFNAGYGAVEISEQDNFAQASSQLLLGDGISTSAVTVTATNDGTGLVLRDGVSGDQITLDGMLSSPSSGVAQVLFVDGTALSAEQLVELETTGTAGNDLLYGSSNGGNLFDGHGGKDVESATVTVNGLDPTSGSSSDTFVFNQGYGQLELNVVDTGYSPNDVLLLGPGITAQSLHVNASADGTSLIATDGVAGDSITLDNLLVSSQLGINGVESIQFADGATMSAQQLVDLETIGTIGNDTLLGVGSGGNAFDGKGGRDVAFGHGGGDTFVFEAGYGELEISETDSSPDAHNVLEMGPGISRASLHVQAARNGEDLIVTDGVTGDQVTLDGMLSAGLQGTRGIESLQFADGSSLSGTDLVDMETTGTTGGDVLCGGATGANLFDGKGGGDLAIGRGNNDTFIFNAGYGDLEVKETDTARNATNVLELGAGISETSLTVRASTDGTSLLVTDGMSGDQIRLDNMLIGHPGGGVTNGVEQIQFADGIVWSGAQFEQLETTGTAASDTLYGGSTGGNIFDGKGGADTEIGIGSDTFVFDRGYGSLTIDESDPTDNFGAPPAVLELGSGISASSLIVSATADGAGVTITDGVDGDVIVIKNALVPPDYPHSESAGIQQLQFADGSTMSIAQLVDRETTGTSSDDMLRGVSSGGNLFDGKGGDDTEIASGPSNTFVFNEGYGKLSIRVDEVTPEDAAINPNVLLLGPGITVESLVVKATADGTGLVLTDGISGDQITLQNMLIPDPATGLCGIQQVQFADGFVLTAAQLAAFELNGATQGADTVAGSYRASAVLDGRGGDDVAIGNSGSDVFLFNQGYGHLQIRENSEGSIGNSSVLQLGSNISFSTLSVSVGSDGTSLVMTDGTTGDQISIDGMLGSVVGNGLQSGVASVRFVDGTTLTRQQLDTMAITLNGTSGSDTIQGTGGSEIFDGKGGADLATGNGNSDTFAFNTGYGQLEINEDYYGSAQPVLRLGAGITADNLSVSATADGTGLVLTDGTAGDQITLDNMLSKVKWGVTEVAFADGATLSSQQLIEKETTSTAANATLYGSTGAEVFNGSGGNEVEIGNGGSDTFIYHAGYGSVQIVEDYDTNNTDDRPVLQLGAGISESNLIVKKTADGSSIVLTDGAAGDQIVLQNMLSRNEWGVTQVSFADGATLSAQQLETMGSTISGTSGSDTIQGTGGSEIFDGKGGADLATGNGNSDTFAFSAGYGQLEINEDYYGSAQPVLRFGSGITADNLSVSATADGTGLVLTDGTAGDQITLDNMLSKVKWGVTEVAFADATTLSSQQLIERETTSTVANATLYGSTGAEVFNGSGGNDIEIGNGGSDTFVYHAGYGSVQIVEDYDTNNTDDQPVLQLAAGISESSLIVKKTADGSSIVLTDGTAGDQIVLQNMLSRNEWGVTQVSFADGSTLSAQQLEAMAATLTGTSGSDTIHGTGGSEIFDGEGGSDLAIGNGYGDTFAFNAGYGQLEINEDYYGSAQPVLRLGAGITADNLSVSGTADGTGLVLTDSTAGDQITLDNMLSKVKWGVTEVAFADGTTLSSQQLIEKETTSTVANATLYGSTGTEVFNGSGGNQVEIGNGGSDTFIYHAGYGSVQIVEDYDANNTDDQPVLQLGAGISESNLIVTKTLDGSSLVLTDGTAGDQITLQNMLSRNEWGVTQVSFTDGTTLSAQQLEAMATGVTGTPGNDSYTLQAGDGARTIVNGVSPTDAPSGDLSIENVDADNVWLQQVGSDLHVDILGTTTEATIANWFSQPYSELSELTVSGGSAGSEVLANAQVGQLIQAMASFSAGHSGFDPTAPTNGVITDSTLLAAVNNAWRT